MKKAKKILSLFLTIAMTAGMMTAGTVKVAAAADAADSWDGTADVSWYNDGDTAFTIDSAEELAGLAQLVNDGNAMVGVTLTLTTDLDLTGFSWVPIGKTYCFDGVFDGGGYTISNLRIGTADIPAYQYEYSGLFGVLGEVEKIGVIKNVNLADASIYTAQSAGAVAASANLDSAITNCTSSGTVYSSQKGGGYVGGIVGLCHGDLTNCASACSVTGGTSMFGYGSNAGGLAGYSSQSISNCYASGTVKGYKAGGLVGSVQCSTEGIVNCYATGNVSGTADTGSSCGGFLGCSISSNISHCYAAGTISSGSATNQGGFIGEDDGGNSYTGCYWNSTENGSGMTSGSADSTNVISMTSDKMASSSFLGDLDPTASSPWVQSNAVDDGYPVLYGVGIGDSWIFHASDTVTADSGTYTISSAAQLAWVAQQVSDGNNFSGYTIKISQNIDLSGHEWAPIGCSIYSSYYYFSGIFDGNGNVITGLATTRNTGSDLGLFGCTLNATIRNLGVTDAHISSSAAAAAGILVGETCGSAITGCYTTGAVSINHNCLTGGLAGFVKSNPDSAASSIENCYSTASVFSPYFSGGLAGVASPSVIVSNCYATGSVYGEAAGGLIGIDSGALENSYACGAVTCSNAGFAGGLIGKYNVGSIANSYWDGGVNSGVSSAVGYDAGGTATDFTALERTTDTMTKSTFAATLNSTQAVGPWVWWGSINGNYPVIYGVGCGVNIAPTAVNKTGSVTAGGTYSIDLDIMFSDINGDTLTYSYVSTTGSGSGAISDTDPTVFRYISATGESGSSVVITVSASDGINSGTGTITLAVTAASSDGSGSEDSPSSAPATGTITTTTADGTTITTMTATATTGTGGMVSGSVTSAQMTSAISKTEKEAEEHGTVPALEIEVDTGNEANGASLTIPLTSFEQLSKSSISNLILKEPFATVSFDAKALSAINGKASGDVKITIQKADTSALSDADKAKIGNRPVYDFTVTSGNTTISSFNDGTVTISIPYTPAAGEDTNKIVIYYLSDSGELITVPNCVYDASTGTVTFITQHFSSYAVGYNDVSFTDVSGWYKDYVNYLAARKIINGTGDGKFNPDANITRAQFVTILRNLSGEDLSGYTTSFFSDVSATDWYFSAVQWANQNGIASGYNGSFSPDAKITREQMAVMLYHYAKYMGTDVSNVEGMSIREFSDYGNISTWAMTPIQWAINNSIISGNPNGSFAPKDSATRAEAAKMVSVLMQKTIG